MRYLRLCLACCLPAVVLAAGTDQAVVTARVTALVREYSALVGELKLDKPPDDKLDYPRVTELLDEVGAKLEPVSRMAGHLETLTPEQWRQLDEQSAGLTTDLHALRCLSLPLRVWGHLARRGEKPEWGLALDHTLLPLPPQKGFVDATPISEAVLQARAGETAVAQIVVVPLTRDLGAITVTPRDLTGPSGSLKAEQVRCEPLNTVRLPDTVAPGEEWWRGRLLPTKASVPRDLTQAYLLTVAVPPQQAVGSYQGTVTFAPPRTKAQALQLKLEISNKTSEVTP